MLTHGAFLDFSNSLFKWLHTDIRNLLPEAPDPDMMLFYSRWLSDHLIIAIEEKIFVVHIVMGHET